MRGYNTLIVIKDGEEIEINLPIFDNNIKATDTVYSDRLHQWDYKKHNELCKKHFGNQGQYWNNRSPEKIQDFLRDYTDNPNLILCKIEEHENKATGYPLWRFDYKK